MEKNVFYYWDQEDVILTAENEEIQLTDDEINEVCDCLNDSLNNWDELSEMIHNEIAYQINEISRRRG